LLTELVPPGLFLSVWLCYGFAFGALCGLLFRKALVALVSALGGSVLALSIWLPSLLGKGLHAWQVAGPPLVALAVTFALSRLWATGRLLSWATAGRLAIAFVVATLWSAGGLWYRIVEVPDVPEPTELAAFQESLPALEHNE